MHETAEHTKLIHKYSGALLIRILPCKINAGSYNDLKKKYSLAGEQRGFDYVKMKRDFMPFEWSV
jgi:hypothetical protein